MRNPQVSGNSRGVQSGISWFGKRLLGVALVAGIGLSSAVALSSKNNDLNYDPVPWAKERSDGPVFQALAKDGTLWAVWSYRRGLELDIAVSRLEGKVWTVPEIIGSNNGLDDLDPRIAFPNGIPTVVWWQQGGKLEHSRVVLSVRWKKKWVGPYQVSEDGVDASFPNIFTLTAGDGIGVGYSTDDSGVVVNGVQVSPPNPDPEGGSNGPDPIPTISITPEPPRQGRN